MKTGKLLLSLALVAASVCTVLPVDARRKKVVKEEEKKAPKTEYEKIFEDKKKVDTTASFMTLYLIDGEKVITELPKSLLGRDYLLGASVDGTSDPEIASVGYTTPKPVHFTFSATDSLILIKEVSAYRYLTENENAEEKLGAAHGGAVVASFPIITQNPDSTAYVFDITSFFSKHDKRLRPSDPNGAGAFGGLISTSLTHKSSDSILKEISGKDDYINILSLENYDAKSSLGGLSVSGTGNAFTVDLRRTIVLLPEQTAKPRLADPRVAVRAFSKVNFANGDRGSKSVWYTQRWNLDNGRKIVFYVDTLFTDKMASAISKGILKWNDAFVEAGLGEVVEVKPYSSEPDFDAHGFRFSTVRFEPALSGNVRSSLWADPRSGEIISASIVVPMDALHTLHPEMLSQISESAPELKSTSNDIDILYEGLQATITRQTGYCLGLVSNFAATLSVPSDSLRSPSYTSKYGLSASIMDKVPYNFFAEAGDKEKGVALVHTNVGVYDKFAIKWIYGEVPGAVSPEDEVPYLDKLISDSKSDPMLFYVRKPVNRGDFRYTIDPRCADTDLGNDPVLSVRKRIEAHCKFIAGLDSWINEADRDYTFRPYLNATCIDNVVYPMVDLMYNVGGFYVNEVKEGDGIASYETVSSAVQKKAMEEFVALFGVLDRLDATKAWRDIFFVRSFGGYMQTILLGELAKVYTRMSLQQEKNGGEYSLVEAYSDMADLILKEVRSGKEASRKILPLQYQLVGLTLAVSNINIDHGRGSRSLTSDAAMANARFEAKIAALDSDKGFEGLAGLDFTTFAVQDYMLYKKLLEINTFYKGMAARETDKELRQHYAYISMAIDRALMID